MQRNDRMLKNMCESISSKDISYVNDYKENTLNISLDDK